MIWTTADVCMVLLTIPAVVVIVLLAMNLKKTYDLLTDIRQITQNLCQKLEALDAFGRQWKEARGAWDLVRQLSGYWKKRKNDGPRH